MNIPNTVMIAIAELRPLAAAETTIEARLRATMRAAHGHWLVIDEAGQFKAAVGAVILESSEGDQERINRELRMLNALSAAMNGIPVDFGALEDKPEGTEWLGLQRFWKETAPARQPAP